MNCDNNAGEEQHVAAALVFNRTWTFTRRSEVCTLMEPTCAEEPVRARATRARRRAGGAAVARLTLMALLGTGR